MTDFLFKTQPYEHQLEALEESYDKQEYALFMEMGCGKSKVVIDNFVQLFRRNQISWGVIFVLKRV